MHPSQKKVHKPKCWNWLYGGTGVCPCISTCKVQIGQEHRRFKGAALFLHSWLNSHPPYTPYAPSCLSKKHCAIRARSLILFKMWNYILKSLPRVWSSLHRAKYPIVTFKIGTFKIRTLEREVEKSMSKKTQCNWMKEINLNSLFSKTKTPQTTPKIWKHSF